MLHKKIDQLQEEQNFAEKTLQKGDLVKYYSRSTIGKRGTVIKINKKSVRIKDKKGKIHIIPRTSDHSRWSSNNRYECWDKKANGGASTKKQKYGFPSPIRAGYFAGPSHAKGGIKCTLGNEHYEIEGDEAWITEDIATRKCKSAEYTGTNKQIIDQIFVETGVVPIQITESVCDLPGDGIIICKASVNDAQKRKYKADTYRQILSEIQNTHACNTFEDGATSEELEKGGEITEEEAKQIWIDYVANNPIPPDIPINPEAVYGNKFKGYKDWIGSNIDKFDPNKWFWNHEYRHYMRSATIAQRKKVYEQFIREGLELNGISSRHAYIVVKTTAPEELKHFKLIDINEDIKGLEFKKQGGQIGKYKLAYYTHDKNNITSKMYDDLGMALKEAKSKKHWLVMQNLKNENGTYKWNILPYGDHKNYSVATAIFEGGGQTSKDAWIELSYTDPEGIDWAKDRLTEDKVEEILKNAGIKCKRGKCNTGGGITIKTGLRDIIFEVPAQQRDKAVQAIKAEFDKLYIKRKDMNIRSGNTPALQKGTELRKRCPIGTKVQTLLFDKDTFTEQQAKDWAKNHGFKYGKVDEKENTYRLRQEKPEDFREKGWGTIPFTTGVKAVTACPIKKADGGSFASLREKEKGGEIDPIEDLWEILGDTAYKIDEVDGAYFVELQKGATIDEVDHLMKSFEDIEITKGFTIGHRFMLHGVDADESRRRGRTTIKITSTIAAKGGLTHNTMKTKTKADGKETEKFGGVDVPKGKYEMYDKVYSWQNTDYPAEIVRREFRPYLSLHEPHKYDTWGYLVRLKTGQRSKWMNEASLFKTKQEKYADGGTSQNGIPSIVQWAMTETVTDIGQLTAEELKDLNRYVKQGVLEKGQGGPFPKLKTVYAIKGFPFKNQRDAYIKYHMSLEDGGKVGGRGFFGLTKGTKITNINQISEGDIILTHSKQFNADNTLKIVGRRQYGDSVRYDAVYWNPVTNTRIGDEDLSISQFDLEGLMQDEYFINEIKYNVDDKVKMFDDEPPLHITKIFEWADKGNTYDLESADGNITRGNISWTKIKPFAKGGQAMQQGTDLSVANEIRNQIGHKAFVMLGAYDIFGDKNALVFKIRGSRKWKYIRIELNPSDLYDITFKNWRKMDFSDLKEKTINNVYADQMHSTIEKETELYTSLEHGGLTVVQDEPTSDMPEDSTEYLIDMELKPLIEKIRNIAVMPGYRSEFSDNDILGLIVSKYSRWDFNSIQEVCVSAMEDANFRPEAEQLRKMVKGGPMDSGYKNNSPKQVWQAWSDTQKTHFLTDHFSNLHSREAKQYTSKNYEQLPETIKTKLMAHIKEGRYAKGGTTPSHPITYDNLTGKTLKTINDGMGFTIITATTNGITIENVPDLGEPVWMDVTYPELISKFEAGQISIQGYNDVTALKEAVQSIKDGLELSMYKHQEADRIATEEERSRMSHIAEADRQALEKKRTILTNRAKASIAIRQRDGGEMAKTPHLVDLGGKKAKGGAVWGVEVRKTPDSYVEQIEENLTKEKAEELAQKYRDSGKYYQVKVDIPLPFAKGGDTKKPTNLFNVYLIEKPGSFGGKRGRYSEYFIASVVSGKELTMDEADAASYGTKKQAQKYIDKIKKKYPGYDFYIRECDYRKFPKGGPTKPFHEETFTLESITDSKGNDIKFPGFTKGELWNGWATPYFTKVQADKLIKEINTRDLFETGKKSHYSTDKDAYIIYEAADQPHEIEAVATPQGKLYPIGAYAWTWWSSKMKKGGTTKPKGGEADYARQSTEGISTIEGESIKKLAIRRKSSVAPKLEKIKEMLYMEKDLQAPELKSIGESLLIMGGNLYAPKLETIGWTLEVRTDFDAPELQKIGHVLDVRADLRVPKLKTIGGGGFTGLLAGRSNIFISANFQAPNLEKIGGNLFVKADFDAPKLEKVGGWITVKEGIKFNAPNLKKGKFVSPYPEGEYEGGGKIKTKANIAIRKRGATTKK